jgi:hypothetical protein
MSDKDKTTPGDASALLPTVGPMGVQGFEQVQVKGNRLDNLSEANAQTRQMVAYRSRWSDTFSDAILWCCASGALTRLVLMMIRNVAIAPIYPLGFLTLVIVIGVVVMADTLNRFPELAPSVALRAFYVIAGLLSTLL